MIYLGPREIFLGYLPWLGNGHKVIIPCLNILRRELCDVVIKKLDKTYAWDLSPLCDIFSIIDMLF
jgi:hypothetical protein